MSTTETIQQDIEKIVKEGHEVQEKVTAFIEQQYHRMLDEAPEAIEKSQEVTRMLLDGVAEGLKSAGDEGEKLLESSVETMTKVATDYSERVVADAKDYAQGAREVFDTALKEAEESIDEVQQSAKEKMEKAYADLQLQTEQQMSRMKAFGDEVRRHAEEKGKHYTTLTEETFKGYADQAQRQAHEMGEALSSHNQQLLNHSRDTVSDWLNTMANMVKPK